jgi:rubrerythrin
MNCHFTDAASVITALKLTKATSRKLKVKIDSKVVVYSTHCMKCENGKNYTESEHLPESCPVCGEHKEYSILELDDLTS